MRINVVLSLVKNQIIAAKPLEQFVSASSKKGNKVLGLILRILGLIAISSSFLFLVGSSYFGYFYISKSLNIIGKGIAFCAFSSTLFLLFISTTYLEYTFFRGKDISLWHLLPISKSEFFISRFFVSYYYSLLTNLIATLPLIVCVFYFLGFSFLTVIASIVLFILLPVLPLIVSSLLVTLKVYIFKGKNIKIVDFFFNNAPFMVAILYLSKTSNEMLTVLSTNSMDAQVSGYFNFISNIGSLPYFSLMGAMFFNFKTLLLFLVLTTGVFFLSYLIISPLFVKCINLVKSANNSEVKKHNKGSKNDSMSGSSILVSLMKRELFILQGDKGFLAESISEAFIPLILIIVWQITGSLGSINSLINEFSSNGYFVAMIFLIVQLFGSMVLISSTSVSREGKLFKINKLLPIDVKLILKAKVYFHLVSVTILHIFYLVAFVLFFKLNINNLFWMIPLLVVNSVNISLIGLILDYNNPKLEWEVATSAMKRNINALFGMGGALVVIAPSIIIIFFKSSLAAISIMVSIAIIFVLWKVVNKVAYKQIYQD